MARRPADPRALSLATLLGVAGMVLAAFFSWRGPRPWEPPAGVPPGVALPSGTVTPAPPPPVTSTPTAAAGPGFRTRRHLREHYEKHGAAFGRISEAEYLARAQALRDAPVGGAVRELRRADGVRTRFDAASGAFLAFDADGTIRTFFRPNDGARYFERQARRAPG